MRETISKKMTGTMHPQSGYHHANGNADPPAMIECSTCRSVVRAAGRRYRELDATGAVWVDHAHQPAGAPRTSLDEGYAHDPRGARYPDKFLRASLTRPPRSDA